MIPAEERRHALIQALVCAVVTAQATTMPNSPIAVGPILRWATYKANDLLDEDGRFKKVADETGSHCE